ncbi:MAG: RagB/SusD family nutrient uptake outer membrane protein [Prevotellaceae bacterium]|jgi:hypothetical protein|nr:RagB/SusD family nutrient uptake outer membrane protein [Prevotellaceae bacterium]
MKKKYILILWITLLFVMPISCDLDRFPYDGIEQSQAFKTVEDAANFNNGMYATLRGRMYGNYAYCTDIQADLFNASMDYGNNVGSVYRWDFLSGDYDVRDLWRYRYDAIANCNNILDNIDNISVESDEDRALLNLYKGEAYFMRAYYNFELVKRYAKDYEPSTAATDLGLPLTKQYDVNEKPSRSTVEQTYAFILENLAQAKTLLTTPGSVGSKRLTRDCVTALEARVALCMHKYPEAAQFANSLITSNTYPLVNDKAAFKNMWHVDDPAESIFLLHTAAPNELGNTFSIYLMYNVNAAAYTPYYIPQQWVIDLFSDDDYRKNVYVEELPVLMSGAPYDGIWLLNKFPGNPAYFTSNTTNYQHRAKVFRIAEMYLIRAEALAKAGTDDGGALAALNALRTHRGLSALVGLTGTALFDAIQTERTRELLGEGNRMDDLKRWNIGVTRKAPQNGGILNPGGIDLSKPTTDDKFQTWGIPANDILANPNLNGQQNQGW